MRNELRYSLAGMYHGRVIRREATYCFIERDGPSDWIYANAANAANAMWEALIVGSRVTFSIGFSFRGPGVLNVRFESGSS